MEKKNLEEIFWKDGKFVKKNREEVKPEAVGQSQIIKVKTSELIMDTIITKDYKKELNNSLSTLLESLKKVDKKYGEVNAFSKGNAKNEGGTRVGMAFIVSYEVMPCNFYKI